MGGHSYSHDAYQDLSRSYQTKSQSQIFTQTAKKTMHADMNPKGVKFRECRDSDVHPNSVPIIVALDETGSMGSIPENLIKNKLSTLMETVIKNGTPDAAICFCGIGDHKVDHSPLQIGQFESGTTELNKWMTSIELEGGGGGNGGESYHLAWLFAARHTTTDSFEKRGIKGFLFTIGDEWVHAKLEAQFLKDYMGYTEASDVTREELLEEARKTYHVFHIYIDHGYDNSREIKKWKDLLGENLIVLKDSDAVPEVIATTVAVLNGADMEEVLSTFSSSAKGAVSSALATVKSSLPGVKQTDAIVGGGSGSLSL